MAIRRSLAYSALQNYVAVALQIISTIFIARLLTPEQTGVFAVAAVFAALASTFRDFGVAEFLIQEKDPGTDTIRAALTVNIVFSWLMALLLFLAAPGLADFYGSPGVADVMRVQSAGFILIPFGAVTMAWFRREMDFRSIFFIELYANVLSTGLAVLLAFTGYGYMSLAWASLAGVVVTVFLSMALRPRGFPWLPGLAGIGRVFHFGKYACGIYLIGRLGKSAPEMIIGRSLDMAAVGIFSRAYGLVELFNRLLLQSISPVFLPYFARAVREQGTPRTAVLASMGLLTAVGWPVLATLALFSFSAIRIIYGIQWLEAVPLAKLLCAVAAVEVIYYPATEALLSVSQVRTANQLQMLIQGTRIAALLAVIPFGLTGACWALLIAALCNMCISHRYLSRPVGLSASEVYRTLRPAVPVTFVSVLPGLLLVTWLPVDESNFISAGVGGGALCVLAWLAAIRFLSHPVWHELKQVRLLPRAMPPHKPASGTQLGGDTEGLKG